MVLLIKDLKQLKQITMKILIGEKEEVPALHNNFSINLTTVSAPGQLSAHKQPE